MLKLRIITALVLLPIVLGAVFYTERSLFVCGSPGHFSLLPVGNGPP